MIYTPAKSGAPAVCRKVILRPATVSLSVAPKSVSKSSATIYRDMPNVEEKQLVNKCFQGVSGSCVQDEILTLWMADNDPLVYTN